MIDINDGGSRLQLVEGDDAWRLTITALGRKRDTSASVSLTVDDLEALADQLRATAATRRTRERLGLVGGTR